MMNALAFIPMPSQSIVSGIQDIGGIGLSISNTGFINFLKPLYQPMRRPMGTPVTMASSSPTIATSRLARVLTGMVEPSGLVLVIL